LRLLPFFGCPQSYTPKSPAVLRAMKLDYDAYEQVKSRIKAFELMHHPTEKIELIIMGGTFLQYKKKFQYEFIKKCFDALNNKVSENLEKQKGLMRKQHTDAWRFVWRPGLMNVYDILKEWESLDAREWAWSSNSW